MAKKILVVDDEADILSVIRFRLEAKGYEVTTAINGQEALDKLKTEVVDLIITDVLMPVMDGFTLYKELKKNLITAQIPVIVLTARGLMEDTFKVAGVDDFIPKPFESHELLAKVESLLSLDAPQVRSEKKILVAGSTKAVVEEIALQLKRVGCQTDFTLTGPEVISKVVQFLPDVIVMDVQMNDMSAQEVIKVLRRLPQSEHKPVIVYNYFIAADLGSASVREKALAIDAAKSGCMSAGANLYLGRFNESTFIKDISRYLESGQGKK
ncbi:MAG TPA: response regulator [Candidatus Omnitrophota bacterium]|nr:response regulator [Candidatus Omnitrophota bacterium]HPD84880.1 response regulator [Candidatus Omnitrophota bacterium]HRZ03738.1 response regulator [Candidatus Omnitrophota bacterium]